MRDADPDVIRQLFDAFLGNAAADRPDRAALTDRFWQEQWFNALARGKSSAADEDLREHRGLADRPNGTDERGRVSNHRQQASTCFRELHLGPYPKRWPAKGGWCRAG